jgi:drug/metabolite transporter (DMT)-like permease
MNTSKTKAHLALLATSLFFSINFSSIKYLTAHQLAKPFGLNLARVLVACSLFWFLLIFNRSSEKVNRKDLPRFVLCALTGIVINQLFFLKGLSYTYPIHGALLMLMTPIMIAFVAAFWLRESLGWQKLIGLGLALAGAVILVLSGKNSESASNVFLGDLYIIINAISYSFYFILVKPLMKTYQPTTILRMIFLIGLICMLPVCLPEFLTISWAGLNGFGWMNMALLTVGGTFLNYYLNIYGIKILGASVAGSYIYTQPLMTAAISMIFMGEPLEPYKWIAGLFIFTGLFIENYRPGNKST